MIPLCTAALNVSVRWLLTAQSLALFVASKVVTTSATAGGRCARPVLLRRVSVLYVENPTGNLLILK